MIDCMNVMRKSWKKAHKVCCILETMPVSYYICVTILYLHAIPAVTVDTQPFGRQVVSTNIVVTDKYRTNIVQLVLIFASNIQQWNRKKNKQRNQQIICVYQILENCEFYANNICEFGLLLNLHQCHGLVIDVVAFGRMSEDRLKWKFANVSMESMDFVSVYSRTGHAICEYIDALANVK